MQRFSGLVTLLIGIAASVLAFWWLRQPREIEEAPAMRPPHMVPVTLVEAERGTLEPVAELVGGVRAPERTNLGFQIAGRIERMHVRDADRVEAGAPIADLDPRDAQQELLQAQAELALAQAELGKLEAGERSEVIAELEAELSSAEADLAIAKLEVERSAGLLEGRVTSQSAYDRLVAERDAAEGRTRAAGERLATARAGSRAEDIAIARAAVEARRVDVGTAEIELSKTTLRAPFAGVVAAKHRTAGDHVQVGDPVVDLFDPAVIEVELEVPASALQGLVAGADVWLRPESGVDAEIQARLSAIVPAADPASRNFRALVRLDGDDERAAPLLPGTFVRARVAREPIEDAWIVPSDALVVDPDGLHLVRAADAPPPEGPPNPHAPPPPPWVSEWVPVRVIGREGQRAAVEPLAGTLSVGDRIARVGADNAFPGTPLLPAATKGGGPGGAGGPAGPGAPGGAPPAETDGSGDGSDDATGDGAPVDAGGAPAGASAQGAGGDAR